jgi:predicted porin
MKRLLIGSTAIVCAGMLMASGAAQAKKAQKIKLSLSGYTEAWLGYARDGNEGGTGIGDRNNFDVQVDSEITFKGKTTLDNGIKIGVKIEAGSDVLDNFAVDESMIYLSGAFGRVNLGAEDNASDLMQYGADKVGEIGYNKSGIGKWVVTPTGHAAVTRHGLDLGTGDTLKVTYFTPRIEGLQIGISYAPEESEVERQRQKKADQDNNIVSVGVNYVKKVGGANVALAFGYMTKDKQDGNLRPNEDGWSLGAKIQVGAFTIGAAYLEENNEQVAGTDDDSFETWDIAVNYKTGKNTIGIGYLHSEAPGSKTVAGDDETDLVTLEYSRSIGPGVSFKASLAQVDYDGENAATTDDNDGWVAVMGFAVKF